MEDNIGPNTVTQSSLREEVMVYSRSVFSVLKVCGGDFCCLILQWKLESDGERSGACHLDNLCDLNCFRRGVIQIVGCDHPEP